MKNEIYKKVFQFLIGILMLVCGIALILICWSDIEVVFRAMSGIILAIGGLVVLYFLDHK